MVNPTDYRLVGSWLRGVMPGTSRRYLYYINEFCAFSKLSPNQLVSLAQRDKMAVKEKIGEYHQKYVRKGYASNTCRNAPMAIRSFLSYNEIRFGKFPFSMHCETEYESSRIFTRQEVFRMLVGARTPRDKAIISFVVQSGQRVGVVTRTRYGDIQMQIEHPLSPFPLDVDPTLSNTIFPHSFAIA